MKGVRHATHATKVQQRAGSFKGLVFIGEGSEKHADGTFSAVWKNSGTCT
jgi:hypothetical protein